MANVHQLFPEQLDEIAFGIEVNFLAERLQLLPIHGAGRCIKGSDIPLRVVDLYKRRPKGYRVSDLTHNLGIANHQLYDWKKLEAKGQLVNGFKITQI